MTNEKYITSETDAGKWAVLCHAEQFGVDDIEIKVGDVWQKTLYHYVVQIISNIRKRGNLYRIPNPYYKEPWPIGTVLQRSEGSRGVKYVVYDNFDDGSVGVITNTLGCYVIKKCESGSYTPTGEHIDLTPILGENNEY